MTSSVKLAGLAAGALLVGLAVAARADGEGSAAKKLSVDEIVRKANHAAYYQGKDGRGRVKMTIKDSRGNTRVREFTILRTNIEESGDQKFFVYFHKPADVRKMTFLVWKHVGDTDDDRWLYLPALDLVKRIAASDKRTSFVGSNFLYEDVSGRDITEDTHTLTETTETHYLLKSVPKTAKSVEFAYYTVKIDRKTFLPVKTEYYDDKGKLCRVIEALKVETIDKYPTVVKARAADLTNGGETVSEFSGIRYNIGLKDKHFDERSLRRPPREARK